MQYVAFLWKKLFTKMKSIASLFVPDYQNKQELTKSRKRATENIKVSALHLLIFIYLEDGWEYGIVRVRR